MAAIPAAPAPNTMPAYVSAWLTANSDRVYRARYFDGGTEVWMQVEMALYLTEPTTLWLGNPITYNWDIVRELKIFPAPNQGAIADIYARSHDAARNVGVELKCETLSDVNGVKNRFISDIQKCINGPTAYFNPSRMYAIAVTVNPGDLAGYAAYPGQVFYQQIAASPKMGDLTMVWWQRDFGGNAATPSL